MFRTTRCALLAGTIVLPAVPAPLLAPDAVAADKPAPEFGGQDAMALVDRQRVDTDCKIDWVAKSGKRYCFSNDGAKAAFLKTPDENIDKATDMLAAGNVASVTKAMDPFSSDDAAKFVTDSVKAEAAKNNGVTIVDDAVTGTSIPLVYDSIDFTRTLKGYGFFPDVRFHAKDDPQKKYLIDYWVVPKDGKLKILEVRIYKAPTRNGKDWVMVQRQPKPWWWIPAAEHPGETEDKRSWEVMSAISRYVLTQSGRENGTFKLKDDKTGETLPLKFLYVHQPVRRLKADGRYFACTDFRKANSKDEFYDIDFWLDAKTGKVAVSNVKVHKVPELKDGSFVQVPRYNFDPKTYDQVP